MKIEAKRAEVAELGRSLQLQEYLNRELWLSAAGEARPLLGAKVKYGSPLEKLRTSSRQLMRLSSTKAANSIEDVSQYLFIALVPGCSYEH